MKQSPGYKACIFNENRKWLQIPPSTLQCGVLIALLKGQDFPCGIRDGLASVLTNKCIRSKCIVGIQFPGLEEDWKFPLSRFGKLLCKIFPIHPIGEYGLLSRNALPDFLQNYYLSTDSQQQTPDMQAYHRISSNSSHKMTMSLQVTAGKICRGLPS